MFDTATLSARAVQLLYAQHGSLSRALGIPVAPLPADPPIASHIALLCDAANRVLDLDADYDRVQWAWHTVVNALCSSPTSDIYEIEAEFSRTEMGQMLVAVMLWLSDDELITLSAAAQIVRGSSDDTALRWINDQIQRSKLAWFVDPSEPNPQKHKRVRRREVESLRKT